MNRVEKFQKKIFDERVARLSGGITILQVGAQTVIELKDKQLRAEDALNATKAAIEEGVVVGGGCCLLRLSTKKSIVFEKIGADILKRALAYPTRQIAKNVGVNGNTVINSLFMLMQYLVFRNHVPAPKNTVPQNMYVKGYKNQEDKWKSGRHKNRCNHSSRLVGLVRTGSGKGELVGEFAAVGELFEETGDAGTGV
ncbi:UNVERIFIED_CONTAM: Chaperonin 60 subunit beta 4, chloroplastic [Sesamum latifolium]|uniref:Chaperonin 60 subunit beta 4, chloroplastic n=1 Tax=Sesamum latifolium TaxID=2727402 RepID=A0AAW2TN67_9LAMI